MSVTAAPERSTGIGDPVPDGPKASSPDRHATPILIYAPGLGQYPANTADGVAEVIAAVLDRDELGKKFACVRDAAMTAPAGLKLGKTIIDDHGRETLHVFELDYKGRLDWPASRTGAPTSPGALLSSIYAVRGFSMLLCATRRGAKSRMAKLQLILGFAVVGILIFAATIAVLSSLATADVPLPSVIRSRFDGEARVWALATTSGVMATWAAARRKLLGIASTARQNIRYLDDERYRDTIAMTIDEAVNGLRDNGWHGDIHLLGYSFGSLVVLDSLFPKHSSGRSRDTMRSVRSVTTIGCPVDAVRLVRPDYLDHRDARVDQIPWHNIFIPADVFGSNFMDGDDAAAQSNVHIGGVIPSSSQYLDERLDVWQILKVKGLRTHGGYWGDKDEASCFDQLVGKWSAVRQPQVRARGAVAR
ncbi:MAG TPA: hypothetical protein VLD86_05420 [Ilumatobacteraceae bacterium]|nr:hypothetical protein [Ilumatobacteraceae bacterium]